MRKLGLVLTIDIGKTPVQKKTRFLPNVQARVTIHCIFLNTTLFVLLTCGLVFGQLMCRMTHNVVTVYMVANHGVRKVVRTLPIV
tara:strand:+ start:47 stop:301 length:255 start_codon:yes stop_codon:yes gene_type:complete